MCTWWVLYKRLRVRAHCTDCTLYTGFTRELNFSNAFRFIGILLVTKNVPTQRVERSKFNNKSLLSESNQSRLLEVGFEQFEQRVLNGILSKYCIELPGCARPSGGMARRLLDDASRPPYPQVLPLALYRSRCRSSSLRAYLLLSTKSIQFFHLNSSLFYRERDRGWLLFTIPSVSELTPQSERLRLLKTSLSHIFRSNYSSIRLSSNSSCILYTLPLHNAIWKISIISFVKYVERQWKCINWCTNMFQSLIAFYKLK